MVAWEASGVKDHYHYYYYYTSITSTTTSTTSANHIAIYSKMLGSSSPPEPRRLGQAPEPLELLEKGTDKLLESQQYIAIQR